MKNEENRAPCTKRNGTADARRIISSSRNAGTQQQLVRTDFDFLQQSIEEDMYLLSPSNSSSVRFTLTAMLLFYLYYYYYLLRIRLLCSGCIRYFARSQAHWVPRWMRPLGWIGDGSRLLVNRISLSLFANMSAHRMKLIRSHLIISISILFLQCGMSLEYIQFYYFTISFWVIARCCGHSAAVWQIKYVADGDGCM